MGNQQSEGTEVSLCSENTDEQIWLYMILTPQLYGDIIDM